MGFHHEKQVDITFQAFLQEYKYDARCGMMWRFVAGMLEDRGESNIVCFFKKIESDPIDFLGLTHQRSIMHCLDKAVCLPSGNFRAGMKNTLSQWLVFECAFKGLASLASESEFPDNALHNALLDCAQDDKVTILLALDSTGRYLSQRAIKIVLTLFQDDERHVRSAAAGR
jgi:hypothetical protein